MNESTLTRGLGERQKTILANLVDEPDYIEMRVGGSVVQRNVFSRALKTLEARGLVWVKRNERGRALSAFVHPKDLVRRALK